MRWVIKYADGSTFSSEDGAPHEAPRWGVMRVYREDERVGVAYEPSPVGYWIWRENWMGLMTESGLWDYLGNHPEPCVVLMGRTLPEADWEAFIKEEAEFITGILKSGWRSRERPT